MRLLISFLIVLLMVSTLYANVVGVNGATYSIAEPDAYDELMEKVRKTNWNTIIKKYKESMNKVTRVSFNLGKAEEDRVFYVDPTYTLQFDIVDANGRIIYPKGFQFNPLDYISFPYTLVFFNANSVDEIAWIKKQEWFNNWNIMFLVTSGDVLKAERILGRTVFAATSQMLERFNISKTPSIMFVQDKQIVIKEVGLYGKNKKSGKRS